jgi:hypothetical protein
MGFADEVEEIGRKVIEIEGLLELVLVAFQPKGPEHKIMGCWRVRVRDGILNRARLMCEQGEGSSGIRGGGVDLHQKDKTDFASCYLMRDG